MRPSKGVILDFSGTLSLGASLFARPESLLRALQDSGLWRLGVNSVGRFWGEIVDPTWQEGSTTSKGYKRLIVERLQHILSPGGDKPSESEMLAAASEFVDSYLSHSTIDPAWKELLDRLLMRPDVWVIIATDHYAEATGHILNQLRSLGVEGAVACEVGGAHRVVVANSADLGHHKANRAFWENARAAQGIGATSTIVIIDDFGFNEQSLDSYADPTKIRERFEGTVHLLSIVFDACVTAFSFFLTRQAEDSINAEDLKRQYRNLTVQAERFTMDRLHAADTED